MADARPGRADAIHLLEVLTQANVRFVVIGGVAAVLLGSPYATEDLDICPSADPDNLEALAQALRSLDALEWVPRKEGIKRDWSPDMLNRDETWMLVTSAGPLDLLFAPAATRGYKDLVKRAQRMSLEGFEVTVASIEDMIAMKEAAGRERDLVHLPALRKIAERAHPSDG